MPTKNRKFHIGDVLSITGDRLVSRDGIHGLQRALSFMAGEDIYTHQIRRVMDEARPVILAKFPLLANAVAPNDIDETQLDRWVKEQAKQYGEFLALPRMTIHQHQRMGPHLEARQKLHSSKIKTVRAPSRAG
jgi:hypothetical protein